MGVTRTLAAFAADIRKREVPRAVLERTKEVIVDSIACALGAHVLDLGRIVTEYARESGGPAEARILGTADVVSRVSATFANGELMNALDFDEVLLNWGHQAPYVIPPALAVAERLALSGTDLLHAVAVGYDVGARVSAALAGSVAVAGTPPALSAETIPVYGFSGNVFGGAAATGILLGLDPARMADALGTCGHLAPVGTSIKFGALAHVPMTKYGCAGWIAQCGLTAALLAERGFTGDTEVLEGPYGFWRMIGSPRWDEAQVTAGLGSEWWILRTSFKEYPCCRFMHHAMDLVADLVEKHAIAPETIERITVRLLSRAATSSIFTAVVPQSPLDAQFSVPYVVAASAYGRHRFPELLSADTLRDPKVLDLAARVEVAAEPRLIELRWERFGNEPVGPLDRTPTTVEIVTRRDRYTGHTESCRGDSWDDRQRFKREDLSRKFARCAAAVMPPARAERALTLLWRLDEISDVREVTETLIP